jgi:hypothetical protein
MTTMDLTAIVLMGAAALVSAVSFGIIANYLFDHGLADRNNPLPNMLDFYRKYRRHTRETTGAVHPLLWVHMAAAGTFIAVGVLYTLARFIFGWTY